MRNERQREMRIDVRKFTDVNTFSLCSTGETRWAALGERTACCSWQERRKYLKVRFPCISPPAPGPLPWWHLLFPIYRDPIYFERCSHPSGSVGSTIEQVWWRRGGRGRQALISPWQPESAFSSSPSSRGTPLPSCVQTFYNSHKSTLGKIVSY